MMEGITSIDDQGRVNIPVQMRERLDLRPGENVIVRLQDDHTIIIKKAIPVEEFIAESHALMKHLGEISDKPFKFEKLF
jgi:AbrB family looped-hinge helix DNA binding protein